MMSLAPLRAFVADLAALIGQETGEAAILARGRPLLARLVADDGWLPASHARSDPTRYRQYPLHIDPTGRFSVVSFVWAPGQSTPIHDHTVWGLVGVLRGAERVERFRPTPAGLVAHGPPALVSAGEVDAVGPDSGDLHRVANALADAVTVSIHVYGADIGRVERATYDVAGRATRFVSGYADAPPLELSA